MKRLGRRVAAIDRVVTPRPDSAFLAYARAMVAYGGGDPTGASAVELARWLEWGRREGPCGPG